MCDENEQPQDLSIKKISTPPPLKPVASINLTPANNIRQPFSLINQQNVPTMSNTNSFVPKIKLASVEQVFKRVPLKVLPVSYTQTHLIARTVPLQGSSASKAARPLLSTAQHIKTPLPGRVVRPVAIPANVLSSFQVKQELHHDYDTALDLSKTSVLPIKTEFSVKNEFNRNNSSFGASPILPRRVISAKIAVPAKLEPSSGRSTPLYPRKIVTTSEGNIKIYTSDSVQVKNTFSPTIVSRPAFPGLPAPSSSQSKSSTESTYSHMNTTYSAPSIGSYAQIPASNASPSLRNWSEMSQHLSKSNNEINAYQGLQLISEVASRVVPAQSYSVKTRPLSTLIPKEERTENSVSPMPMGRYEQPTSRSPLTNLIKESWRPPVFQTSHHHRGGSLSPPGSDGSNSSSETSPPSSMHRASCRHCNRRYATLAGLSRHQQQCTPGKCYSCPTCGKTYTSCGALKMHIRTHTLPCKCHVCGKAFSRPWLLQGHIRTHTGEKPFNCTECNRSFADRSNLRAHQQTHATVKKYACEVCKKTFSRMSLLNKHEIQGCQSTQGMGNFSVAPNISVQL